MATALQAPAEDIRLRMDRMYRPQRHIYDLTRKYYLLGRDRLIDGLDASPGQTVLDIGCGTGRNLVRIGRRFPRTRLFGLDAAEPMLTAAAAKLKRAGVRATLARGVAEKLDASTLFAHPARFDHVTISYCLSMVDDPSAAIRAAAHSLAPGGRLHVVDFGDMAGLPGWMGQAMRAWLARFHVRHRPEVERTLQEIARGTGGRVERIEIARRYALLHRLRLPPP